MATDTNEINKQRLDDRLGKPYEERQAEATELIADTLESIKAEMAEMNQKLEIIANKE